MHHSVRIDHAVSLVPISLRFGGGFPSKNKSDFWKSCFFLRIFRFCRLRQCNPERGSTVSTNERRTKKSGASEVRLWFQPNPIDSTHRFGATVVNRTRFSSPSWRRKINLFKPRGLCLPPSSVFAYHFPTSWSLPTLPWPPRALPFPDPNPVVFAYPFLVVIFATGISVLSKRSLRLLCEKKSNCVPLFVLWTVLIGTIGDNSVQTVMRWYC